MHPVLLVFLGGAAGSLARYGAAEAIGTPDGLPIATLAVNLFGAFLLGVLLTATARERARLLLGTGFLGGFTTYSALTVETDGLLRDGRVAEAIAYAVGSVIMGILAALAGILVARKVQR